LRWRAPPDLVGTMGALCKAPLRGRRTHLRKRGKIWYGTVYDQHGKREERSTGCTDKAAARAVLATWEREAADPDRAAASTTFNDALMLLLEDRQAHTANGGGSRGDGATAAAGRLTR
jgi:hypothetical protein